MIIYNVTVNIEPDVHEEWLAWMKDIHIPEVMGTGCFRDYRFCRVLVNEESGTTYSVQYSCDNMEAYQHYSEVFAPALQKKHRDKYEGRFVAFRTLLETV